MRHQNLIRLLAVFLTMALQIIPVSADAGDRLAVEREVFDYLANELMLSNAAACGVLANIEHESSFQPTIFGDKGTSYGLCQWHNGRYSALRGYCSALGMDYRTVEGQMAYLRYELGNRYTNLLLTLQSIGNTPDGAYRAAYLWCVQIERPSNIQARAAARGELAQGKYWARYSSYNSIVMVEPEEKPEPDPEILLEQLQQNPVTIPLPPEKTQVEQGQAHYFRFQKPEFIYFMPYHLPESDRAASAPAPAQGLRWQIPALAAIGGAMVVVVLFPTKKRPASLYRRGKYMVK